MKPFDDTDAGQVQTAKAGPGDETGLALRAGAGDKQAFDQLFDLYFKRTSSYFRAFAPRDAEAAVAEVLTELFGSLPAPSDPSLAERAYRLALATERRHAAVTKKKKKSPKVAVARHRATKTKTLPAQL